MLIKGRFDGFYLRFLFVFNILGVYLCIVKLLFFKLRFITSGSISNLGIRILLFVFNEFKSVLWIMFFAFLYCMCVFKGFGVY